ncbi:transthyretin domain protein [Phyllosticta citricarpa]|uniref:hydroxyisourate hydrolase n=1 Tax=Phyllosticta paracitricarpa TaxID=2016321 RepID=A0ABR1NET4_9PEZI
MPKPKPETINRALAIAAHLADAKTQQQETVVSAAAAANSKSNSSSAPPALNRQNNNKFNADTIAMAQSQAQTHQRPPITCHVLDTTTGRPAAGLPVTLSLLSPSNKSLQLSATTNVDGRVAAWTTAADGGAAASATTTSLETLFGRGNNSEGKSTQQEQQGANEEELMFALRFETRAFWESRGVAAFFPEVEVGFVVRARDEHYHVPLLLGPFNYTTYRGS